MKHKFVSVGITVETKEKLKELILLSEELRGRNIYDALNILIDRELNKIKSIQNGNEE